MLSFSAAFQPVSVPVGVLSLHYSERDASCSLHDLRTASTRHSCVHCSGKHHVTSCIAECR